MDKLGNRQTKDRIADMLRKEIISGKIKDGQELTQEQLAAFLEVSRMPIREALLILELEGLLLRLPNRHIQVVGFNEYTVFDNMRIIAAVEAEIALILMENDISSDNIDVNDDRQFHNWLSLSVDNHYLRQTHSRLLSTYPQYAWEVCKDSVSFAAQNKKIKLMLNCKNADAIRESIREYYHNLAQVLLSHVKEVHHA